MSTKSSIRTTSRFQNAALYVGPTPATGGHYAGGNIAPKVAEDIGSGNLILQLHRIQSVSINEGINRTDVFQFGEFEAIDRPIIESPTVGLTFDYLLANMYNESGLGFHAQGQLPALSGILLKETDEKNYFLKITPEGTNAVGDLNSNPDTWVFGIGNGYVTSYSTQAAVNSFPTVSVGVEGLNLAFETGTSGTIPALVPQRGYQMTGYLYTLPTTLSSPGSNNLDISVLRPGDITMSFRSRSAEDEGILSNAVADYSGHGVSVTDAHLQSYNLSFNIGREQIQKLGSRYTIAREITAPIPVSLTTDMIVTSILTGSLHDIINCDNSHDVEINIQDPACSSSTVIARYLIKNCKIDSVSYNQAIGGPMTANISWNTTFGSNSNSTKGVWFSGIIGA